MARRGRGAAVADNFGCDPLADLAGGGGFDQQIGVGVGVNVDQQVRDLPERPVFPASSLALELERQIDRAELLVCILAQLERHYELWLTATSA